MEREKRKDHAQAFLNEAIEQNTNVAIGVGVFAVLLVVIFIVALCTEGSDIFSESFGAVMLVFLLLFLCGGLLWAGVDEISRHKKLLQDVDGNLEEIERIESEVKKRIQKSKSPSAGGTSYHSGSSIESYWKQHWRETIPHSEYTKYHIKPKDYDTYYEYEDALRKAKNHYDRMHK